MKLNPFCMCCAVNKQERSIRRFSDMDRKTEYMQKVMGVLANAAEEDCAPSISQNLKELYSSFWGEPEEDYSRIKHEFNRLMLDVEDSVEKKIRQSADPLEMALVYARIGNYIDFAALAEVSPEVILSLLDSENKDPLDPEEYSRFLEELRQAKKLVYITDNCGEIVLDKLAVKILKEQYPDLDITVLVRGFPTVNDATLEDAEETGMTAVAKVMGNGSNVCGTWFPGISPESKELMDSADILLAKGQGNFETLNGCGLNIYYLFLCKCEWFQMQFSARPLEGMFLNERRAVSAGNND